MIEIDSDDVMQMRDESFAELLDEINSKARQTRTSVLLACVALVPGLLAGLAAGGQGFLLCLAALPAWLLGGWFDSYRRTTVLYYDLEGDAVTAYNRLASGFDGLNGCAAKWHIEAGGAVQDLTTWKRNAGASHLVQRKATKLAYDLPAVIKSNVTPPALHVGRQIMYFMPDVVLVKDGGRVGAVKYTDLNIRWQDSRFIETERVPSDANIVDYTWQHPNRSGGPDRRFKNNRQIPICLYEAMHLTSNSGVNELVEFSRTGIVAAFVDGCRKLAALPRERAVALPTANATEPAAGAPIETPDTKHGRLKITILSVLGVLLGFPLLANLLGSASKETDIGVTPALVAEESDKASEVPSVRENDDRREVIEVDVPAKVMPSVTENVALPMPVFEEHPVPITLRYTKTSVNLREGPGTTFAVIAVVRKGAEVSVVGTKGGWSRVRVDEQSAGWMANSMLLEKR